MIVSKVLDLSSLKHLFEDLLTSTDEVKHRLCSALLLLSRWGGRGWRGCCTAWIHGSSWECSCSNSEAQHVVVHIEHRQEGGKEGITKTNRVLKLVVKLSDEKITVVARFIVLSVSKEVPERDRVGHVADGNVESIVTGVHILTISVCPIAH